MRCLSRTDGRTDSFSRGSCGVACGWVRHFRVPPKMIVLEMRIVMPMTVGEYNLAQLYTVALTSMDETGGGEGIEVVQNEHFEDTPLFHNQYSSGQYTRKIYRFANKVPWWVRKIAPAKSLVAHEEAWNAFPYCKTVAKSENNDYTVTIESMHLPDRGTTENALELPPDLLEKRKIVYLDIAGKLANEKDYKKEYDPTIFKSTKTGRGQLKPGWSKSHDPVMCAYKVIQIDVHGWMLVRGRIYSYLSKDYPRLFHRLHRQMFCTIDRWYGLSLEDLREFEEKTKEALLKQRMSKSLRGAAAADE